MINLSPAAIREVQRLGRSQLSRSNSINAYAALFRLGIAPGGCCEFYYTLEFDSAKRDEDVMVECEGIGVVVDAQSWKQVNGITIDYSEDLMGGGFRFHNPNATRVCGCGNSFSVGDTGGS
ncbi:iron-sulfur cluster assembly accessory protein [[Phormidium] sp. ETS-05]|uniref:HesB/IscA family protein n=1 Tax=[Phormidium] sp. ETS-05 TaxID=222819 RepID=UPI0018EECFCC|nr:iron-sulfur cluster assembly accessory protein [[Phormidium] sp. ETS-05]